ncbi:hypothetical protein D3C71_1773500 [compost metagenome]
MPGCLGADEDVKGRLLARHIIEHAEPQVDLAAAVLLAEQAGAAVAAEGEGGLRRLLEAGDGLGSPHYGHLVPVQPADRGVIRPRKLAALAAMAVAHVVESIRQAQADGPAQATGV